MQNELLDSRHEPNKEMNNITTTAVTCMQVRQAKKLYRMDQTCMWRTDAVSSCWEAFYQTKKVQQVSSAANEQPEKKMRMPERPLSLPQRPSLLLLVMLLPCCALLRWKQGRVSGKPREAAKKEDLVCPFPSMLVLSSRMVWYIGSLMGIHIGMNNGIKLQDQSGMS
jgi:hypothetical protein